jgi:hypothetical protein
MVKNQQLLYRKVGENVEYSLDFTGFYNMNIISQPLYITKAVAGGRIIKRNKNKIKKSKKIREQ